MLKGFKEFLLRGNVIDLAVAVVVGAAFSALVASLVADLLTPLIAAIGRKPDFSQLAFTLHGSTFHYGRFLNALISFLLVCASLYFVVVAPMKALNARRAKAPVAPVPETQEIRLLSEIRDLLSARESGVVRREGSLGERGESGGHGRTG